MLGCAFNNNANACSWSSIPLLVNGLFFSLVLVYFDWDVMRTQVSINPLQISIQSSIAFFTQFQYWRSKRPTNSNTVENSKPIWISLFRIGIPNFDTFACYRTRCDRWEYVCVCVCDTKKKQRTMVAQQHLHTFTQCICELSNGVCVLARKYPCIGIGLKLLLFDWVAIVVVILYCFSFSLSVNCVFACQFAFQ